MNQNELATGNAVAGGVLAIALLETLFEKGTLSLDEARGVLDRAMKALGPVVQTPGGSHAAQIIGNLQRGKFSKRG